MKLEEILTKPEISEIKKQYEGEDKIIYLSRNSSLLEILAINYFNGYHVSQIVVGKGWKDKLDWVRDNYETVLKPMEFNGSHVSQIVVGKGWKDKLDWVRDNYETVLKLKGFNPYQTAKILYGKEWYEKIQWIENKYNPSNNNPEQVRKAMVKKNWKEDLGYAA